MQIERQRQFPKPRQAVVRMKSYQPPTSGRQGKLRLDFNENTVGCSGRVIEKLKEVLTRDLLTIYPEYIESVQELSTFFGVRENEFLLTNGTDEAIQRVIHTYVDSEDEVVILRPSYAMYEFYAELAGVRIIQVDYLSDLSFPEEELLKNLSKKTKAVFISNPNNPTGTLASKTIVEKILKAVPHAIVFVDEAYFEFCGETVLSWIGDYSNLVVSRTFSKAYGLAALRLGCLFSNHVNMSYLQKAQSPYSVNWIATICAREAISDVEYVNQYVSESLKAKEVLVNGLKELNLQTFPTHANFVLVKYGSRVSELCGFLRDQGILVRDRSKDLPGCFRITMGSQEQTQTILVAIAEFVKREPC